MGTKQDQNVNMQSIKIIHCETIFFSLTISLTILIIKFNNRGLKMLTTPKEMKEG